MGESTLDMQAEGDDKVVVRVMLDVEALAREIASRLAPDGLLDAADVATLLKCSPRYVVDEVSRFPGFPKAIRLVGPNGRRSNPRWQRREVIKWLEDQTQRRPVGRPRKNI